MNSLITRSAVLVLVYTVVAVCVQSVVCVAAEGEPGSKQKAKEPVGLLGGVHIETSAEHNCLLRTAQEFIDNDRVSEGILLIQRVLDTAGDSLTTQDHMVYRPIRFEAERVLNELKPDDFAAYRTRVDGEAKGLLKSLKSNRDRDVLRDVARRLYLSSHGDDAVYLLGCMYVDDHRFVAARRCFSRILTASRPVSVPLDQALLRYAFVCGQLGDVESARDALKRIEERGSTISKELLAEVRGSLQAGPPKGTVGGVWNMAHGTSRRTGLQEQLYEKPGKISRLIPLWTKMVGDHADVSQARKRPQAPPDESRIPADQIVSDGSRLYHRSANALICRDSATGKTLWRSIGTPSAKTDEYGRTHQMSDQSFGLQGRALSLIDGVVYYVDPRGYNLITGSVFRKNTTMNNRLVALDADTGKLKWAKGHTADKESPFRNVRILSPPVKSLGTLLLPLTSPSGMYLMALSESNGDVLWRKTICGTTADRITGVTTDHAERFDITVEGDEVYVSTGRGVVVAMSAINGDFLWASRYVKEQQEETDYAYAYLLPKTSAKGWHTNTSFVYRNKLVAIASDSPDVHIFNRETGQLQGSYKVDAECFCIGFADGLLIGTSGEGAFAFSVADRRIVWKVGQEGITGIGVMTKSVLYVPEKNRILRIAWRTGQLMEPIPVALQDKHPVGNLFISKNGIHAVGMNTIVGLGPS